MLNSDIRFAPVGKREVHNPRFVTIGDCEVIMGYDQVLRDQIRSTPIKEYIREGKGTITGAITHSGSEYTFTYGEDYNRYQNRIAQAALQGEVDTESSRLKAEAKRVIEEDE